MSRLQIIFKDYQDKISLVLCIVTSFFLIFNNDSDVIKQSKVNSLNTFSFLYAPFNWLDNQLFLTKKLEVLSSENLKLNLENQVLKVHENENIRYREFLNFKKRDNFSFIGADVISKGVSSNMSSIMINRGIKDGVKIVPDDVEGILRWIGDNNCEIVELKKISDIKIGDVVLTSNLSIYFPPNLPIGEVIGIYEKSDSSNKVVRMKLYSDLSTINQLFVVQKESNL